MNSRYDERGVKGGGGEQNHIWNRRRLSRAFLDVSNIYYFYLFFPNRDRNPLFESNLSKITQSSFNIYIYIYIKMTSDQNSVMSKILDGRGRGDAEFLKLQKLNRLCFKSNFTNRWLKNDFYPSKCSENVLILPFFLAQCWNLWRSNVVVLAEIKWIVYLVIIMFLIALIYFYKEK